MLGEVLKCLDDEFFGWIESLENITQSGLVKYRAIIAFELNIEFEDEFEDEFENGFSIYKGQQWEYKYGYSNEFGILVVDEFSEVSSKILAFTSERTKIVKKFSINFMPISPFGHNYVKKKSTRLTKRGFDLFDFASDK